MVLELVANQSVGNDLEVRLLHTAFFQVFAVLGNEELLTAIAFSGSKLHKNRIYYLLS